MAILQQFGGMVPAKIRCVHGRLLCYGIALQDRKGKTGNGRESCPASMFILNIVRQSDLSCMILKIVQ
jgi:hypothetical protein